jgi:hypothetical protein
LTQWPCSQMALPLSTRMWWWMSPPAEVLWSMKITNQSKSSNFYMLFLWNFYMKFDNEVIPGKMIYVVPWFDVYLQRFILMVMKSSHEFPWDQYWFSPIIVWKGNSNSGHCSCVLSWFIRFMYHVNTMLVFHWQNLSSCS